MNRRHFVMSSAIAAGGAFAKAFAGPNDRVRVACVGVRGQGNSHDQNSPDICPGVTRHMLVILCPPRAKTRNLHLTTRIVSWTYRTSSYAVQTIIL